MSAHRAERLAEMIREELTDLIGGELRDPRVGLAQVTEVKLAPELRVAHVFVGVLAAGEGRSAEERATLEGLIAARGYLRAELARRLQIRQVPELRFELDRSEQLGARLDLLLKRAARRRTTGEGRQAPAGGRDDAGPGENPVEAQEGE